VAVVGVGRAARSQRRPALAAAVAPVGLAVVTGAALGLGSSPALATFVVGATLVAAGLRMRPMSWCLLAFASPLLSRVLTATGVVPQMWNFVDVPLVIVALLVGLANARAVPSAVRPLLAPLGMFVLVVVASTVLNGSGLLRGVAALTLTLEPVLLLLAVLLAAPTRSELQRAVVVMAVLAGLQVPFAVVQFAAHGIGDEVRGTLLRAGAGAHVMPGVTGVLVAAAVAWGLLRHGVALSALVAVLLLAVAADAKQVLFALPLSVVAFALAPSAMPGRAHRRAVAGVVGLVAVVTAISLYRVSAFAVELVEGSLERRGGKAAVAGAIAADMRSTPVGFFVGFGPGETVSRLALLSTPGKSGEVDTAPVRALGLGPGARTEEYRAVARKGPYAGVSSFTDATSSLLGLVGDFGVAGTVAFGWLVVSILVKVRRSASRLAPAAFAGWALLLPLAVVFDWLEQPPFTLAVALVTALAIVDRSGVSRGDRFGGPLPADIRQVS
jgi:hypothetical protein